jgi:hypothetical protein
MSRREPRPFGDQIGDFAKFFKTVTRQKFGGLRFYVSHRHRTDAILQRIEIGESESLRSCEVCGKPGKLRDDCIRTVCDAHASL